jgi:Spx/MgsR family transcriptional regulator
MPVHGVADAGTSMRFRVDRQAGRVARLQAETRTPPGQGEQRPRDKRETMIKLYGISNCDTIKKARAWLAEHEVDYEFHNYKKAGIDEQTLRRWSKELGWRTLLNTRGMMWRKVAQDVKDNIDETSAIRLMLETPSIIKRPVLDTGKGRHVGFRPEQYQEIFR